MVRKEVIHYGSPILKKVQEVWYHLFKFMGFPMQAKHQRGLLHPCEHSANLGFLILQEVVKISCANLKILKVSNLFFLPLSGWFIDQIVTYNIWICGTDQRHLLPV